MAHSSWGAPGVSKPNLYRLLGVPGIPMYVHKEVGVIHQYLANNLKNLRARGAPPLNSSGGYVKRYIAGTKTWSNHAWGLATDYNAPTNPYARGGTTDFRVAETRTLVNSLGGMRWGWDYTGKKDAMHFEWIKSVSAARISTEKLNRTKAPTLRLAFGVNSTGSKVKEIKMRLGVLGLYDGSLSEVYDENLASSVKEFQKIAFPGQTKEHDGIVGQKTIQALDHWDLSVKIEESRRLVRTLETDDFLVPGDEIHSRDGEAILRLQGDGNLVLYHHGVAVWASVLRGNLLGMQSDGNLVLYLRYKLQNYPIWNSGTNNEAANTHLVLQDDGNLVLYGTKAVWDTGTLE